MRIFEGVPWRGAVKRQWDNRKRRFSGLSDAISLAPYEMRPTLFSISWSLVPFPLTPKYMTLNGHFMFIFVDPRKDSGSFVDEKLRALHRRNLNK